MNSKGAINLGIIVTFIIVAVAVGYFVWEKQTKLVVTNQSLDEATEDTATLLVIPSTATQQISSDWKTYTNTQYGFSVKYPSDWSWTNNLFNTGEINYIQVAFQSPENRDSLERNKESHTDRYPGANLVITVTTLAELGDKSSDYRNFNKRFGREINNLREYVQAIADESGSDVENVLVGDLPTPRTVEAGFWGEEEYFLEYGGRIYVISSIAGDVLGNIPETEAKIISTFKFTN